MKKIKIRNNTIFKSKIKLVWFKSYMIVVAILVVGGIFALSLAKNMLNNENQLYCNAIIESEKNRTDEKLSAAINLAAKIAKDKNVISFAELGESPNLPYDAYELKNILSSYFLFEDSTSEAYIVFDKSDYVVGSIYTGDTKTFKKSMQYKYSESITNVFDSEEYGIDLFKQGIVYKLPILANAKKVAQIYIFIDTSYILEGQSSDIMNVYIANKQGDISYLRPSVEDNMVNLSLIEDISSSDEVIFADDSVMLVAESSVGNMYYIFEMSKSRYKQGENFVAMVMVMFFALCIVSGIYISIKMIEKNYYPIQQMLEKLKGNTNLNEHEYTIMNNAIDDLVAQNRSMFTKDKKKTEDLKNIYFTNLFKLKNIKEEQIIEKDQLRLFGVDFPYDNFIACVCYLDDISYYKADYGHTTREEYALCNYVVQNVANDIFVGISNWISCEVDGMLTFIFNVKEKEISDLIIDKIITLETLLNESINIKAFLGISGVHKGLENLSVAYDEIRHCRKKQKKYFDNSLFYNEIIEREKQEKDSVSECFYFPVEQEKRICECIRAGQEKEMRELVNNIIRENIKENNYSLYKMKYLGYDLICTVAKILNKNYDEVLRRKLGIKDVFYEIEKCRDFEEMEDKILRIMSSICNENSVVPAENRSTKICKMVKEYIENNYSNPNLSLVSIANEFNLNDTYLSSTYKKFYSIGLTDYLRFVRMEHAKELLTENVNTVEKIAEMVGYNSARAFSRAFKLATGVTPKVFASNQK